MPKNLTMKDDIIFKAFCSRSEKYLKSFLSAIIGEKLQIKKIMRDARLEQLSTNLPYKEIEKIKSNIIKKGR